MKEGNVWEKRGGSMQDKKAWLRALAVDFLDTDVNRMGDSFGEERMWAVPLVGFAAGDDALFQQYKASDACGVEHWTPAEAFATVYPGTDVAADELTVVSWVLPQTEEAKASFRCQTHQLSERWARTRIFGETINDRLREHMVQCIREAGYEVMAPVHSPEWKVLETPELLYTSRWSERHVAHAAGLGTFGLCDALITPAGKAHRLGSVVLRLKLEADARPYSDRHAYCLYYMKGGNCRACINRCSLGALSKDGHDKKICRAFIRGGAVEQCRDLFGLKGYSCGFCQTAVPCESGIPAGLG